MAMAGIVQADYVGVYPNPNIHIGGTGYDRCTADMGICDNRTFGDKEEQFVRIHNLEVEVVALKALCQTPATASTPANYSNLEQRVTNLEVMVKYIQEKVLTTLQTAITIFQKLIK